MSTSTGFINVSVSATKQSFLTDKTAYLYTVAFDGGLSYWTTVYDPGAPTPLNPQAEIPLINAGKLYVIQTNLDLTAIQGVIASEAFLKPEYALAAGSQFRYDSFEYALGSTSGGTPQGNLTSVNGFGFPMSLSVSYTDGTASMSAGYETKASDLITDLGSAGSPLKYFSSADGLFGEFLYAGSPSTAAQPNYTPPVEFGASHWTDYLTDISLQLSTSPIRISGIFNGAPDAANEWHNQAFYNYTVSFDTDTSQFVLTPEQNSQVKGVIKVTLADLAKNIYAIDSTTNADIYSVTDGVETLYKSEFLGANDQFGAIFTQFLTGFDLGYLGQSGVSPASSDGVNLNYNWNWSPIYAFGENLQSGSITPTFDAYSKVFFDNSNSYGSQYSDNAMSKYIKGGPLLNLFQTLPDGTNQTVDPDQITLTIFDDSEMPTGYVAPVIYDYIAPPAGGYGTFPDMSDSTFANLVLNLGIPAGTPSGDPSDPAKRLAQTSWFADPSKIALSYEYLTGTNQWSTPAYVYADDQTSLWSQWSLSPEGGRATLTPGTSSGQQGTGALLLNQVPVSKTEGVVNWHRVTVYDKTVDNWETNGALKTFNIYTTADGSTGFYYQDGQLAVDGGATFSSMTAVSGPTATLNLTAGSGTYFDPSLMYATAKVGQSYATSGTPPSAPVVGTFNASDEFEATTGQSSMISPVASLKANNIGFGWTGLNPAANVGDDPWVKNYTNKVSAQNKATVSWDLFGGKKDHGSGTVSTVADIDGKWTTSNVHLNPGKYTVTMTEYLMVNGVDSGVQFAQASNPLTLTVMANLDTVQAIRDAYLVNAQPVVVGTSEGVLVNDTGSPAAAELVSGPSNASAFSFNADGSFSYTPAAGFVGIDSFSYYATVTVGGVTEKSLAQVEMQVVPQIGQLPGSLADYSTVGLAAYGYFNYGVDKTQASSYLDLLDQFQEEGMSQERAFYNLANVLGETARAEELYPFLANPTTNEADINAFLDTVYQVLFNRAPDDVGRAYWVDDIQKAIGRGEDIDPYVFTIMNGAQVPDMQVLTAKSLIAQEQIYQQFQHDDSIPVGESNGFLAGANTSNLLTSMATVFNDAIA